MTTRRTSVFVAGTIVGAFVTAGLFGATLAVYKRLIEESEDRAHVGAEGLLGEDRVASDRSRVRLDDCIGNLSDELDQRLQALRDLNKVFAESLDVSPGTSSDAEGEFSNGDTHPPEVGSAFYVDHEGDCALCRTFSRPEWM